MTETGINKNTIITELCRSTHGKLAEYVPLAKQAAHQEPEFFAHLISWNRLKGQIRDSKVALPIISLTVPGLHPDFTENALAHLTLLNPRLLLKAYQFALEIRGFTTIGQVTGHPVAGHMSQLRRLVRGYLRRLEANYPRWERAALQHRGVLKDLYALTHAARPEFVGTILFGGERQDPTAPKGKRGTVHTPYPAGSLFEVVANLHRMDPLEAAGAILTKKIPFLVAKGALGKNAEHPDCVLALIKGMTATELVTNTKAFEKMGIKTNPALRGAWQEALGKASTSTANVLKTTAAAEAIEDEELKENLRGLQERQIQSMGVEGNWLVLADKSGSMSLAIETARHVAATLAKMAKGKVALVFFDDAPMTVDVTGLHLDVIKKATQHIVAGGGTSIGCGLQRMLEANEEFDGIAIVSDGGENRPPVFSEVYKRYCKKFDKSVPVYFYKTLGDTSVLERNMAVDNHDIQVFDLRTTTIDYYSLPNLVATMRTNRYSLVDEIMATRLLKLAEMFKENTVTA
jgi:hypothetical protein